MEEKSPDRLRDRDNRTLLLSTSASLAHHTRLDTRTLNPPIPTRGPNSHSPDDATPVSDDDQCCSINRHTSPHTGNNIIGTRIARRISADKQNKLTYCTPYLRKRVADTKQQANGSKER